MFRVCLLSLSCLFLLSACASGTFRERQEKREKMASSAGMYCEFINGDSFPDIDVELNMAMAHRCDSSRPFSITNYKNTSDQPGILYCCAMAGRITAANATSRKETKRATPAVAAPTAPPAASGNDAPADDVVPE